LYLIYWNWNKGKFTLLTKLSEPPLFPIESNDFYLNHLAKINLSISSFFSLAGKRIVITGASSGIGRQCAIRCAEAGASLLLLGRDVQRLEETVALLPKGSQVHILSFDLTKGIPEDELNTYIQTNGKIDGLVHAAGVSTTLPLRMIDEQKLNHFFATNITPAILLTKWLSKPSVKNDDGASVVWFSSVMGLVGESGKTLYALTKGALLSGAKSLAIELAPKKIRVNCLAPGVVETPMTQSAVYSQQAETRAHMESLHPLGLGKPDDVALTVCFLLSKAARWITGTVIPVDGGYTAR
jgi:NAD(P)-dependent dehydrogenase (short-subunit alcohol dehydrogenase family)